MAGASTTVRGGSGDFEDRGRRRSQCRGGVPHGVLRDLRSSMGLVGEPFYLLSRRTRPAERARSEVRTLVIVVESMWMDDTCVRVAGLRAVKELGERRFGSRHPWLSSPMYTRTLYTAAEARGQLKGLNRKRHPLKRAMPSTSIAQRRASEQWHTIFFQPTCRDSTVLGTKAWITTLRGRLVACRSSSSTSRRNTDVMGDLYDQVHRATHDRDRRRRPGSAR
jgi:hypothetical protein